ncbi:MAG: DNA mismatch repair protein MutL, partial [Thermomicrobiales bacterium]|nr:DNA mismatch repair protein MutL [Thermomicrobiales bacterium]
RPRTELAQIAQTVRRLALAAPETRFLLVVDDRVAVQTSGSDDLLTTLTEVYGRGIAPALIPLGPIGAAGARISGVVAGPEATRAGRGAMHLSVNGRSALSRPLLAALESAYRPLLPRGRHPVAVLTICVPPERVDVNIHPAKEEVRLRDERALGEALGMLLREALGRRPIPLAMKSLSGVAALAHEAALAETAPGYDAEGPIATPGLPTLRLVGQLQGRLLLLEGEAGLYLVDQHRAHERILYERMRAARAAAPRPLVDPLLLELRSHQAARFAARLNDLAALGFEVETFGGRTFLLRGAPRLPGVLDDDPGSALVGVGDSSALAQTLLELADDPDGDGEGWQERLLVSLACRSAVRRGQRLDRPAMRALVEGLGGADAPAVCPHGSPLLMRVSGDVFERQFGWR